MKLFLKQNKVVKKNKKVAVSDSFLDENGNPIEWELRHISSKENDKFQTKNMIETPVKGKPGVTTLKLNTAGYINDLLCAAIVFPDLNDSELQDSYGVMGAEDLLDELLDNPGEKAALVAFVNQMNNLDKTLQEKVDEVKN